MRETPKAFGPSLLLALGLAVPSLACSTLPSAPVVVDRGPICEASADWLPDTPVLTQFMPVPHPASECAFYRAGWQNFLRALQPSGLDGHPALVDYPTTDDVFIPARSHPVNRAYLGGIRQAGGRNIVIDGNGHALYYGIHVNDAYQQFINDNGLQTAAAIQAYPDTRQDLFFPPGVVELRSAWQVVEGTPDEMASQMSHYVTMTTTVPTLTQGPPPDYTIHEDRDTPRVATVRLLAIHVASTLVGHPEFVWATFEHSTGMARGQIDTSPLDLQRDVAPILDGSQNPTDADPTSQVVRLPANPADHILYEGGTPANQANRPFQDRDIRLVGQQLVLASDPTRPARTAIYRAFPASKSNTVDPDANVSSLNQNVGEIFRNHPDDKRGNYRLVGAQWMDKPGYFAVNGPIQNDSTSPIANPSSRPDGKHIAQDGSLVDPIPVRELLDNIRTDRSDSEFSIVGGEDRLVSTAMESFTQSPSNLNNCFSCHNTQGTTVKGIPTNRDEGNVVELLRPGLLNVSHVLSQFLLEEYEAGMTP